MGRFPAVIESERLTLRAFDPADAAAVNVAIVESIAELREWMPWADHVPPVEETLAHLAAARARFDEDSDHAFTIVERVTGMVIGAIGFHPRPMDPRQREVGYWLRTSHTGRGYATEAVRAVTRAGIEGLGLTAVQLKTSERNVRSQRVAERAGFTRSAVLDDGRVDPGGFQTRTVLFLLNAG